MKFHRVALAAAGVAATMAFAVPASAQGGLAGTGAVGPGTVSLTPGFPFGSCLPLCPQSFSFSAPVTGVFVGAGTTDSAGDAVSDASLTASANGMTTVAENVALGVGSVSATASGSDICAGACWYSNGTHCLGVCTSTDSAVLVGVYVRVGAVVAVELTGSLTVNGYAYTAAVAVEALFLPNQTPPATTTSATFAGAFQAAGVLA
jgi:hypothetical protein